MADITTVNPTTGEDIKEYNYMTNENTLKKELSKKLVFQYIMSLNLSKL